MARSLTVSYTMKLQSKCMLGWHGWVEWSGRNSLSTRSQPQALKSEKTVAGPLSLSFWLAKRQNFPAMVCSLRKSRVSLQPCGCWASENSHGAHWVNSLAGVEIWNAQIVRNRKFSCIRIFAFASFETLRNGATWEFAPYIRETNTRNWENNWLFMNSLHQLVIANQVTK